MPVLLNPEDHVMSQVLTGLPLLTPEQLAIVTVPLTADIAGLQADKIGRVPASTAGRYWIGRNYTLTGIFLVADPDRPGRFFTALAIKDTLTPANTAVVMICNSVGVFVRYTSLDTALRDVWKTFAEGDATSPVQNVLSDFKTQPPDTTPIDPAKALAKQRVTMDSLFAKLQDQKDNADADVATAVALGWNTASGRQLAMYQDLIDKQAFLAAEIALVDQYNTPA